MDKGDSGLASPSPQDNTVTTANCAQRCGVFDCIARTLQVERGRSAERTVSVKNVRKSETNIGTTD